MAVLEERQGSGVGRSLLQHVHRMARQNDWQLWCNAREVAVPFYAKLDWRVEGDAFDVPGIGKHFKMFWERSD
jgi:GNAT superfamily N-acetyltransferase